MSVNQSTFDVFRGKAYAGMSADGSYQNVDGLQLESGKVVFGAPVCMGSKDNLCIPFDATKAFAGIAVREFYMMNGGVGDKTTVPFEAGKGRTWDLDLGVFGRWMVKTSNPVIKGQKVTVTSAGLWAGGELAGNYVLEGATFKSSGAKDSLVIVELTGGRQWSVITA